MLRSLGLQRIPKEPPKREHRRKEGESKKTHKHKEHRKEEEKPQEEASDEKEKESEPQAEPEEEANDMSAEDEKKGGKYSEAIVTSTVPAVGTLSFGAMAGFCVAAAAKRAGRAAAVAFGSLILVMQLAAYRGWVYMDWPKVEDDLHALCDANGNGEVDMDDIRFGLDKTVRVLSTNLGTTAAGFASGFAVGLQKG